MIHRVRRLMRAQAGYVTLWFVITFAAFLALIGLVTDGAGYNQAQAQAYATAQSAARAGANSLQASAAIGYGQAAVGSGAVDASRAYLNAAGLSGSTSYHGDTVTVTVVSSYTTRILSIIGIRTLSIHATAAADLLSTR